MSLAGFCPMQIRPFLESDESAVIALWNACKLTRPWNDPRKDIARKLTVQRELFFVGVIHNDIVASVMAAFDGHRGWINYLAVHPDFQRRKLGATLMKYVEQRLLDAGCPKINLQVRSTNENILKFYRDIGYEQDDVISLGKRLLPDAPAANTVA